jgi:hypothetical protein
MWVELRSTGNVLLANAKVEFTLTTPMTSLKLLVIRGLLLPLLWSQRKGLRFSWKKMLFQLSTLLALWSPLFPLSAMMAKRLWLLKSGFRRQNEREYLAIFGILPQSAQPYCNLTHAWWAAAQGTRLRDSAGGRPLLKPEHQQLHNHLKVFAIFFIYHLVLV